MIYRQLGKENIKTSIIGFGCWQLGGALNIGGSPEGYGKTEENEIIKAIHYAVDHGVNFFDTADIYGLGKSESRLGKALKEKRKDVIICSKVGYIPGSRGTVFDVSYDHIISACNSSLKRLSTDYIDIYLLHSIPEKEQMDKSLYAL